MIRERPTNQQDAYAYKWNRMGKLEKAHDYIDLIDC